MISGAANNVKTIDKYAISMIAAAVVMEAVIIYFEWPALTVNFFTLLLHAFVLAHVVCGTLVLMRFKKGLALFRLMTPIVFYRFYQQGERESLREITSSEEVIAHFVR